MTRQYVGPFYRLLQPIWKRLTTDRIAAPIHDKLIHHVLIGAASVVFVNAHELTLLSGIDASSKRWNTPTD